MLLIRPKTFEDGTAALSSSNIAEGAIAAWSNVATYANGDRVAIISGTAVQVFKSLVDGNLNNNPASTTGYWAADGSSYTEYDAAKRYLAGERVIEAATHRIYESLSGGTSSTVTMTIASPCAVSWAAHGLPANTPVLFETTGALPTGLVAGTIYYVLAPATNSFNVSATPGGAAINTSGGQSGIHTAIANPNKNHAPDEAGSVFWLDLAPTNRWAMFDSYNATQTVHPFLIDTSVQVSGRIDSLALLNLTNAVSARVIMTTPSDGTVFDQTYSLISSAGIVNWYAYFFEDVDRSPSLFVDDLPTYLDPVIRVMIEGDGATVGAGLLSLGLAKNLGETEREGASTGITDYSRKETDDFGNFEVVERAFAKRGTFKAVIQSAAREGVEAVLTEFRAVPAVYVVDTEAAPILIFGFFRDFSIEPDDYGQAIVSLELEGLT